VGWLAQVSADVRGHTIDIAPLSIPVLAAVAIGSFMYLMSRILLAVSPHGSTAIAIAVAAALLATAVLVARRANTLGPGALIIVLALGAVALISGGVGALAAGARTEEKAPGV